jgi:DNA-binding response OmpR family regulator
MKRTILSIEDRTSDIDAGLETGVKAYLVKPFSPWELVALVNQLTGIASEPGSAQPA